MLTLRHKYIDIHTHNTVKDAEVFEIINIFPEKCKNGSANNFNYSTGIHPWHILDYKTDQILRQIQRAGENCRIMAIGEIGIDRACDSPLQKQIEIFEIQKEMAENLNLPLIIHCVKAYSDILAILKKNPPKTPWIFHSYTGNQLIASKLLEFGCYLSFGQKLFTNNKNLHQTFKNLPLDQLFLETDESNISIKDCYQKAAEIKGIDIHKLIEVILGNFKKCFSDERRYGMDQQNEVAVG